MKAGLQQLPTSKTRPSPEGRKTNRPPLQFACSTCRKVGHPSARAFHRRAEGSPASRHNVCGRVPRRVSRIRTPTRTNRRQRNPGCRTAPLKPTEALNGAPSASDESKSRRCPTQRVSVVWGFTNLSGPPRPPSASDESKSRRCPTQRVFVVWGFTDLSGPPRPRGCRKTHFDYPP